MKKTISASEAETNFLDILQDVERNDEIFVIEQDGSEVAAIIPVSVYQQWQQSRERYFDMVRQIAERANVPEKEAEELAEEAIRWARSNKNAPTGETNG